MKPNAKQNSEAQELISLAKWLRAIGRSDTTGWRWCQAGWLRPINIAGRPYLTGQEIRQFQARAAAGEFSKAPAGAAAASRKALVKMQSPAK
jgi:hypothetical protein